MNKATVEVQSSNIRNGVEKQVEEKVRENKKRVQKVKFEQERGSKHWGWEYQNFQPLWKKLEINNEHSAIDNVWTGQQVFSIISFCNSVEKHSDYADKVE